MLSPAVKLLSLAIHSAVVLTSNELETTAGCVLFRLVLAPVEAGNYVFFFSEKVQGCKFL